MRGAWLALLVACGDNTSSPPDASGGGEPLTYRLVVLPGEPADRPLPEPLPTTLIDGVPTNELEVEYGSLEVAAGDVHRVELRHGDVVIARYETAPLATACVDVHPVAQYSQVVCALESGDIRFLSERVEGAGGACIADGFCGPRCACGAGERCTSLVVSLDPFASHLGCAPIGDRREGQTCRLVDDPAGAFDDCGADLLCVEGRCRTACNPKNAACASGTCRFVPGHAPEIGICQ